MALMDSVERYSLICTNVYQQDCTMYQEYLYCTSRCTVMLFLIHFHTVLCTHHSFATVHFVFISSLSILFPPLRFVLNNPSSYIIPNASAAVHLCCHTCSALLFISLHISPSSLSALIILSTPFGSLPSIVTTAAQPAYIPFKLYPSSASLRFLPSSHSFRLPPLPPSLPL